MKETVITTSKLCDAFPLKPIIDVYNSFDFCGFDCPYFEDVSETSEFSSEATCKKTGQNIDYYDSWLAHCHLTED